MKTLYLECNMGAAGDMLMAALTELMPDKDAFVKELNDLQIPQVNIERTTIAKCGIMGLAITLVALFICGPASFLIPAMAGILFVFLLRYRLGGIAHDD